MKTASKLPVLVEIGISKFHQALYKNPVTGEIGVARNSYNPNYLAHEKHKEAWCEWKKQDGEIGTLICFLVESCGENESKVVGVVELQDGRFNTFDPQQLKAIREENPAEPFKIVERVDADGRPETATYHNRQNGFYYKKGTGKFASLFTSPQVGWRVSSFPNEDLDATHTIFTKLEPQPTPAHV